MKIGNPIRNIPFILTKVDSVKRKKKKELKGEETLCSKRETTSQIWFGR